MKKIALQRQEGRKKCKSETDDRLGSGDRSVGTAFWMKREKSFWNRKCDHTEGMRKSSAGCRAADGVGNGDASPRGERLLSELGHEVIVAHARNVRLIGRVEKDDRLDARMLARLVRIDRSCWRR